MGRIARISKIVLPRYLAKRMGCDKSHSPFQLYESLIETPETFDSYLVVYYFANFAVSMIACK